MTPKLPLSLVFFLSLAAPARAICPFGMAEIDGAFCVDKFEAGLIRLTDDGGEPWSPYETPDPKGRYKAVSRAGRVPQGYISGAEAAKACANAGKRLCSMEEWTRACKGSSGRIYPYGSSYKLGVCNEHTKDAGYKPPMYRLFGPTPKFDSTEMNDPRLDQLEDTLAPSKAFAGCTNGNGAYDMVGNLHEWVSDRHGKEGARGYFKGGYFVEAERNRSGCDYRTGAHAFSYHDYSTGFRCCAELN